MIMLIEKYFKKRINKRNVSTQIFLHESETVSLKSEGIQQPSNEIGR